MLCFCATTCEAAKPGLIFSSAIDLNTHGETDGIVVDSAGNTYMTGWTRAAGLQTTPGVVQPQFPGGYADTFVVKLNRRGKVVFATFLGGSGDDEGLSIAVDTLGDIYIGGLSNGTSPTLPTTPGAAFRTGSSTGKNGFVVKLNPTGTAIIYSTLVPGAEPPGVNLAIDKSGNAYFGGTIMGSDNSLSPSPGAFQPFHKGISDVVVAKFSPTGALAYATFLGGSATNEAGGIAVDSNGNAYISGNSGSPDFPVTAGAFAGPPATGSGAFVVKLNAQGSAPVYSTFLGPADVPGGIRLDSEDNAYVSGVPGADFPTTPGSFQSSLSSPWSPGNYSIAFLTKLNSTGTDLIYSSLFASASRFDVDSAGNAYVTGLAGPHFPVTRGALQRCVASGGTNMFLTKLDPAGKLAAASYLGGTAYDYPTALTVADDGSVYLAESVQSIGFPGLENTAAQGLLLVVSNLFISNPGNADLPCLTRVAQNSASLGYLPVAPGELITLRGLGLGPEVGVAQEVDASGHLGSKIGDVQVFFNNMPAPLLYVQSEQLNVQVPWELAGLATAQIQVEYQGTFSNTGTLTIQDAAPALFRVFPTSPASAKPPFPGAILNQDGTVNSPSNPAAQGSIVSLFGTGGGVTVPGGITGEIAPISSLGYLAQRVQVQLNRYFADVVYAGPAPGLISGVFQLNIRVPAGPFGGSSVFVFLSIGGEGVTFPGLDDSMVVTLAIQ